MKTLLALVSSLLIAACAFATEASIQVSGRTVLAATDLSTDSPRGLSDALFARLNREGWHDIIYQNVSEDRAFVYFTQRTMRAGHIEQVRVTLWKAVKQNGQSMVESWTYSLSADQVNTFLDDEFSQAALQFKNGKR